MAIEFTCPTCGKVLKLRDEAAGKRGRCPYCKGVITVPESPMDEGDLIEIVPADAPKKPPALSKPAVAKPPPPAIPPKPVQPQATPAARVCPGCKQPLAEKAVICINCGLNLKTGKKLQTVFEEPKPAPEPEKPDEPETDETV